MCCVVVRWLEGAVWWVAGGLLVCLSGGWGCLVIVKLDPERVVWMCGGCSAIAVSDDSAVRPA